MALSANYKGGWARSRLPVGRDAGSTDCSRCRVDQYGRPVDPVVGQVGQCLIGIVK